jgi:hypothetical protein
MSSYGTWRINKNSGYFLGGTAMKYVFVWDQLEAFPVDFMFWTLGVGNSGFYAWLERPKTHVIEKIWRLLVEIKAVHKRSRKTYGSPRMHLPY